MIKKHLITCSVILVLAIIFKLNICSTETTKTTVKNTTNTHHVSRYIYAVNDAANEYSFADEAIPQNDEKVNRKMRVIMKKHDYHNIQSNILQLKADRWFPIIEPILKQFGIPNDFKYLPLVESGLKEGTSPKGAAGLWQFMPGTARTYGLKVGKGKDERMNIRKSTIAACKYIKELHDEFHNWTLTAAAYNNGSIKLAKAMRAQKKVNYFRMHLNSETGNYVYNLIAMKEIIDRPGKYGYPPVYAYEPLSQMLAYN
ncbi:MAG: lytic transglycosylase domain-containing protein [Mucilaginibacter sp.]